MREFWLHWRSVLAKFGARTPTGRDTAVALALAVLLLLAHISVTLAVHDGQLPVSLPVFVWLNLVVTADLGTIALRRKAPRLALAAAVGMLLVATTLPHSYAGAGIGVLVCGYTVAVLLPARSAMPAIGASALVTIGGGVLAVALGGSVAGLPVFWGNDGSSTWNLVLAGLASHALAGLLGGYIRTRRAYLAELTARIALLHADRAERAAAAVRAERGRIARELHDVAAHDLSAIVVQAGAAERQLDGDPEGTRNTLREIRAQGRRTLGALRELVGIMRAGDTEDAARAPTPGLGELDGLVRGARESGMIVRLVIGEQVAAAQPAASVELAVYRLVQEALTNARRHAPEAEVDIRLDYAEGELDVAVRNGPGAVPAQEPTDAAGYGLVGMRERVQHAGGNLTVGPTRDGGWSVHARFGRDS
ncbi:signal transduction histidine kinase [Tamaricihabitans halophyticus]|uniref:histidine kinase n=1 Tax=Tamaricihabitans halophyticus TaxID=1262583 RepID=A0A4R2R4A1_9PSEU|nr:histidine kinase [Tamaricihabitans halophyticus]TCP57403.1 signal transduction histidine kinase [Tamaricihabitans halophyticus]